MLALVSLMFASLGCALAEAQTVGVTPLRFDVVSIKEHATNEGRIDFPPQPPDGFRQTNLDLQSYIRIAYDIHEPQRLAGLPDWTLTTRYDIVGKASRLISEDERLAMLRDVLDSRFHLKWHTEAPLQSVYVMTAARADRRLGPGLRPRPDCETVKCESAGTGRPDGIEMHAVTLTQLAKGMLSALTRRVVIDDTGIPGTFDVSASWRPDNTTADPNDSRPSLFTALQEQLGLKLEPARRPVNVLVVDSIQRPDPD